MAGRKCLHVWPAGRPIGGDLGMMSVDLADSWQRAVRIDFYSHAG